MSNLDTAPRESRSARGSESGPALDELPGHRVAITKTTRVTRVLPHRQRRMVGPWCFFDHFGPDAVISMPGMCVPPHPHTGLQTVTWLFDGLVEHRDSLGTVQRIAPGELNLMTAGHGTSHSEASPPERPPTLHGVQLWVALPGHARDQAPRFEHLAELPHVTDGSLAATVLVGALAGHASAAAVHSPLVALEIGLRQGAAVRLPVEPAFEHAALLVEGDAAIAGAPVPGGALLYLGTGRADLGLTSVGGGRLFLVGGVPFDEEIVMWWNFVARTHDEIVAAREEWMHGSRFGTVHGFDGPALPAPALPNVTLRPRPRYQPPPRPAG